MKYVLGNGVSALIWAYFNADYKIIAADTPVYDNIYDAFVVLQDTEPNRFLLRDLEIPFEKIEHPIIYQPEGKNAKQNYVKKKLTDAKTGQCIDIDACYRAKKYIKIGDAGAEELGVLKILSPKTTTLIKVLRRKLVNRTIMVGKIKKITDKKIYTAANEYEYEHLVSTISAPDFYKLYGLETDFCSIPVLIAEANANKKGRIITNLTGQSPYVRIIEDSGKAYYEFVGSFSEQEILAMNKNFKRVITLPMGKINYVFTAPPTGNITFFGRNAEWNPDIRIDTCVEKARFYTMFQRVWDEQVRFNSNFVNFSKLNDLHKKQELTKEYILHLYSEVEDLLQSINWKFYSRKRSVDYEEVFEELVDIFKYWLSICLIWGVRPNDFIRKFFEKSEKVQKRFEEGGFK